MTVYNNNQRNNYKVFENHPETASSEMAVLFCLQKRGLIMAYWISEMGTSRMPGNVKSFYCDFRSDVAKLPKNNTEGDLNAGDEVSAKPCRYGSDCLCLEDSSVWILGKESDEWKEI